MSYTNSKLVNYTRISPNRIIFTRIDLIFKSIKDLAVTFITSMYSIFKSKY